MNYNNNEYEILDNGNIGYQPRYPLVNSPGAEFQQMNYTDWMNRCNYGESGEVFSSARDGVIIATGIGWAILGFIPVIGPGLSAAAGVLNVILPYLWPEDAGAPGTEVAQISWNRILRTVEGLIDTALSSVIKTVATTELRDLQEDIISYNLALCNLKTDPNNETYKTTVRREFDNAADQARKTILAMSPITPDQPAETKKNAILLLADYAQAANLHLLLLRDVIQYGESWGFSPLEVQQYYDNPSDRSGMKQRLEEYTNYCVNWYNVALSDIRASGVYFDNKWRQFNAFRRDMTIMVLDIVSLWPTFDPRLYPVSTKSQLTRTVYTDPIGIGSSSGIDFTTVPFDLVESSIVAAPKLFSWLRKQEFSFKDWADLYPIAGYKMTFQNTLSAALWEGSFIGTRDLSYVVEKQTLTIPDPQLNDDIWQIGTNSHRAWGTVHGWYFPFTQSPDQYIGSPDLDRKILSGLPCKGNNPSICAPCQSENSCNGGPLNTTNPCNDKQMYSHRFSYMGAGARELAAPYNSLTFFGYGWTHISADPNNLIDAEKITQIPAVKASSISGDARVVRGPGSTGGDLVKFSAPSNTFTNIGLWTTIPAGIRAYRVRIRYASNADIPLDVLISRTGYGTFIAPATTTDLNNLAYNKFGYLDTLVFMSDEPNEQYEQDINFSLNQVADSGTLILDKIEFIPMEESLEEYEANQALEKARKAVNALLISDAKDALKLNITDYAVDQAANLAECVSEDFHAQEKMILLDQVKFAKRLSHARNLLNYGDFESSDWSGENGWRTSHHVSVRSDNPIFKGRYLHIPGATSSQFSSHVYPTYIYQKVDESKLKSYTRYLVRGFIGNSKDLELLVERYGKDVHVEMDVPNDIQYTLPMNECGGFDRCKPASDQARLSHTCTCNDTAVTHTDCQCKDKGNRTSTNMYTNVPTGSAVYRNGSHDHKSCGCKNNDMYQNRTHPHKSCGCKDPHVFTYHIDTGCVDQEENLGLWFALKIASENGVANIDNLEIIEAQPLTGEALARVKKREQKWKKEVAKKRLETERAVQAAQGAIQPLFTNAQYNRLQFETLFPQIVRAEKLVQQIPYVYHPFLSEALLAVPGMNFDIVQQLSALVDRARGLYDLRNLVQNGTFSSGTGNWHVTDGITTHPEGNTSVLVLSEWNHEASQQLRIDPDRGYVLRVTARKEGAGKGTVTMSDCADYTETLTFTSCDYNTIGTQTMPGGTLSGFVTKTLEIFPDTDHIRIDIGETEGMFKVESVELICMEQMEDHLYDMADNLEKEMRYLQSSNLPIPCAPGSSTAVGDMNCQCEKLGHDSYENKLKHYCKCKDFDTDRPVYRESSVACINNVNFNTRETNVLLDVNGNPVLSGRDYYLLNRYTENKGGGATQVSWWRPSIDEYLGTQAQGEEPFNTKFMFFRETMGYGNTLPLNSRLLIHVPENPKWYAIDCTFGVCLAARTNAYSELWTPLTSSTSLPGTFQFQNYGSSQFLGSDGPNTWLYANKSILGEINFEIVPV
ncbi:insecticidal delta-endotoxin Cry8Ea1 family protein [Bacillus toyonensis]|uniref:insecticidal delta-endotoxin Cry8Ea1 family protein n=1 Tax=Bacillus toyonensis TaxID=155322 RepID=UPI000BF7769C|nr:insecticidal delta-endotoxin Cry8Ea1 family protein [Bacillus toyonensis]PGA70129.1 hypothetical protein COL90_30540 [Bacillus toyonensis]